MASVVDQIWRDAVAITSKSNLRLKTREMSVVLRGASGTQ